MIVARFLLNNCFIEELTEILKTVKYKEFIVIPVSDDYMISFELVPGHIVFKIEMSLNLISVRKRNISLTIELLVV
jgi:hypothetical protein